MKKCSKCKEVKPLEAFYRRVAEKDGRQQRCKQCADAYYKEYKAKNLEFVREYRKEYNARPESRAKRKAYLDVWYRDSPRGILRSMLGLAKRKNRKEVSITLESLLALYAFQDGKCALSGITMTWRRGKLLPTSLSMDRIDPAVGYVNGNVRLVCFAVNAFRGQMSDDEMFNMALAIVSNMKRPKMRLVS